MHATTTRPTALDDFVPEARRIDRRRADIVLVVALVVPLATLGLLMVVGVPFGIAVCLQFALVFVVTTAMDVGWAVRRHRSRGERHDSR